MGNYATTTPFLYCPPAIYHSSLDEARESVKLLGKRIATDGGLQSFTDDGHSSSPIVICVTGGKGGNVHGGVREILNLLPHEIINVADLPTLMMSSNSSSTTTAKNNKVHVVTPELNELYQHKTRKDFDRKDFFTNPQDYVCKFSELVAPYCHVLVNCIYWDDRFPRLLTKEDMFQLYHSGNKRLMVISDISCDINGSIEFLERSTSIDSPCYQYDPILGRESSNSNTGVTMMGVDILPTELPIESSNHFGDAVSDILNELANSQERGPVQASRLPPQLVRYLILLEL